MKNLWFSYKQKDAVLAKDCNNIPLDRIDEVLQIPLMQAILRYAIKCESLEAGDQSKDLAEGDVFAMSVLPAIAADDAASAAIIAENMLVEPGKKPVAGGAQVVADAVGNYLVLVGGDCVDVGSDPEYGIDTCGKLTPKDPSSSHRENVISLASLISAAVLLFV